MVLSHPLSQSPATVTHSSCHTAARTHVQFFRALLWRRGEVSCFIWGITPHTIRAKFPNEARRLGQRFRPRDIQRMIEQRRDPLEESNGVRQTGVDLERGLVCPARVDVEELRVTSRPEGADREAARLLARRGDDITQRLLDGAFVPRARVESREDDELHGDVSWPESSAARTVAPSSGGASAGCANMPPRDRRRARPGAWARWRS